MPARITCVRRLTFEAGHRLIGHESKCAYLHGHSYKVFVHASAPDLDDVGRVIDFAVLKQKIGGWIDTYWDHGFLVRYDDPLLGAAESIGTGLFSDKEKFYSLGYNPTAENIARYLLEVVCPKELRGTGVTVDRIDVHETENCYATAIRQEP